MKIIVRNVEMNMLNIQNFRFYILDNILLKSIKYLLQSSKILLDLNMNVIER